jgi:hypothetical protein
MDVEGIDPVAVYAALMSKLVRTVFAQPDAASAWAQHARVVDHIGAWGRAASCFAQCHNQSGQHGTHSQARKKSPHQIVFRFWYFSISSSWRSL